LEPDSSLLAVAGRVRSFHAGASDQDGERAPNAVLVLGGRIAAVGPLGAITVPANVPVIELPETTITPGLTDAHLHMTEWALARRDIDLAHAASPELACRAVAKEVRAEGAGWVRGRGWNPQRWAGESPSRALLDAVLPGRPVALQSHDMHSLWVNTAALEYAGIGADTADPPGGRIVRDDQGHPTGLLQENAAQLVTRCIPRPTTGEMLELVRDAQAALHAFGITGFHSLPGIHVPEPDPLSVLETLRALGQLRLRVLQHLPLDFLDDALRLGLRSGFGGEWIRIGGVKMFLDGALGSRTAWMRAPYEGASDCGLRVLETADFRAAVRRAAIGGLASTVHAIGDAAVGLALDVLAEPATRVSALPHRIEHVQCFPRDRFTRLRAAQVVCSVQPAHLITDWRAADEHWGEARAQLTYAFRSLLEHGAVLACGSDAPVEPADPRLGLFAATRRTDLAGDPVTGWVPAERITLAQAFRGYTVGAAIAAGREREEGQLTPGAVADFVAWNGDPFGPGKANPVEFTVAATIVGGRVVHS